MSRLIYAKTIWHLPLFFMPQTWHGQMGFRFAGLWTFLLYSIGLAMLMSWVYLRTNRSIRTGFLMHLASNFTANLFLPYADRLEIMRMVVIVALGFALCARIEPTSKQVGSSVQGVKAWQ